MWNIYKSKDILFITSITDYNNIINTISNDIQLIIPIYNSYIKKDKISLIYIYSFINKKQYILIINHPDVIITYDNISIDYIINNWNINNNIQYVLNSKHFIKHNNIIDLKIAYYYITNILFKPIASVTATHHFYSNNNSIYQKYNKSIKEVNLIIPITKHIEFCSNILDYILTNINLDELLDINIINKLKIYNNIFLNTKHRLEAEYIQLDNTYLTPNNNANIIHSKYNIFTTTARPSNTNKGINLSALNKNNNDRKGIISRFNINNNKNGKIISIDFDAYHLRLLSSLIGYKFPKNIKSAHRYLASYYFNKPQDEITDEEYIESKQLSFKLLYGGIDIEFEQIPFFKAVKEYAILLYEEFNKNGYIYSPILNRKLKKNFYPNITQYKLLNYFIQTYETERNLSLVNELLFTDKIYDIYTSRIILYIYDSLIIDFNINDIDMLNIILTKLQGFKNEYPVKITYGYTYNDI